MSQEQLRDRSYELHAAICKLLSHPKRLKILDLLAQGEQTVEELTQALRLPKANISQHLALLRQGNLVVARKRGVHVLYRLANPKILQAFGLMQELVLDQLAAMNELAQAIRAARRSDAVEELTLAELVARAREGEVLLLDVRPPEEYEKGHIQGALSLPLEEIDRRWKELPRDQELVAYCRGPYCILSDRAIQKLREHEIKVRKLSVGYPEWKQAGFPVEKEGFS